MIEQTTFMKRMDTEILDLDRRLVELNQVSSNILERTKERISSSSQSKEWISQEYNKRRIATAETQLKARDSEQCSSKGDERRIWPERISRNMEGDSVDSRMQSQEVRQKVSENRTVIKDMFSGRTRDVVSQGKGYIKDSRPAIPASEQHPVCMDRRSQPMLPTQRRK